MKEFSDLGAGFKIAALDLELRGAGNLLGGEQSGHIEAVGFELYTQMLERAVREMKGEAGVEVAEIATQSRPEHPYSSRLHQRGEPAPAHVQAGRRRGDRIAVERRARRAAATATASRPPAVRNLLDYAALKLHAMRVGSTGDRAQARTGEHQVQRRTPRLTPEKLARFVASQRGTQFTPDGTLKFTIKIDSADGSSADAADLLERVATASASSRSFPRATSNVRSSSRQRSRSDRGRS